MIADAYNTSDIVYWWAKDNVEIEKKTVAQFQNEEVHLSKTVEQYITGKYLFNLDQHLDARVTLAKDDNSLFLLHKRSARFICKTNVLLILLMIIRPVHQIMMIRTTTTITMTIRTMIMMVIMMMMMMMMIMMMMLMIMMMMIIIKVMMITIRITITYLKHPRTPKP